MAENVYKMPRPDDLTFQRALSDLDNMLYAARERGNGHSYTIRRTIGGYGTAVLSHDVTTREYRLNLRIDPSDLVFGHESNSPDDVVVEVKTSLSRGFLDWIEEEKDEDLLAGMDGSGIGGNKNEEGI